MFVCSFCYFRTYSVRSYVEHCRVHSNNYCIPCGATGCHKQFRTLTALCAHACRGHRFRQVEGGCTLRCTVGGCKTACEYRTLLKHMYKHIADGVTVTCPVDTCGRKFSKRSTFSAHMSIKHRTVLTDDTDSSSQNSYSSRQQNDSAEIGGSALACLSSACHNEDDQQFDAVSPCDEKSVVRNLSLFLLKLQCRNHIPSVTVDFIAKEVFSIHQLCTNRTVNIVRNALAGADLPLTVDTLCNDIRESDAFKIAFNATDGLLRSHHCRQAYYRENFRHVEPKQISLGHDKTNRLRHFHYIPVKSTLVALLQDPSVLQSITAQRPSTSDRNIYEDIIHGCVYKQLQSTVNGHFLELIFYQDAFQVVNPLGSARKVHKIVAVYLALGNLPCYARTNIDNLQLALLCRETDLTYFGPENVMAQLIADLKDLEINGVAVGDVTYSVRLVCTLGDNLGSHWLGGFSTNFSSNRYICRYCLVEKKKNDAGSLCKVAELRNPQNYDRAVTNAQHTGHPSDGVVRKSVLNDLTFYNVCMPGLPPCLGHDLFEGIVQFDLALVIRNLMKKSSLLSYNYLNQTVAHFEFLGHDSCDKPSAISDSASIGGHAVQNWCFLRLLPIWVHDVIDLKDEVWQFVLLLREIVELICAPKISHDQILYLERLVNLYVEDRLHLFHSVPLRPKHHYLLHYPWLIMMFGPLIRVWTMRMESKHSFFKQCARNCHNYINVTKTLSDTHQLSQMYLSTGVMLHDTPVLCGNYTEFSSQLFAEPIVQAVSLCSELTGMLHCSAAVIVRGTKYAKDCFVVIDNENGVAVFGKVVVCLMDSSDTAALVTAKCVSYKDSALGLYVVTLCNNCDLHCILVDNLWDYCPLPGYVVRGLPHIPLKHAIVSTTSAD